MSEQVEPREKGQSIILVAIAMLALVIFAGIAVDVSHAYVQRRIAQNAADGAALAGARNLRDQMNELKNFGAQSRSIHVKTSMNDFAERNGVADTDGVLGNEINANVTGWWLGPDYQRVAKIGFSSNEKVPANIFGVEAYVTRTAQTFFGGIIGLDGLTLNAEAAVSLNAPACGVTCVVPIATNWLITYEASTRPTTWTVWISDTNPPFQCYNIYNGEGSGNFGWLNWTRQGYPCEDQGVGPCSNPCLEYNLDPANCSGYVHIGDWAAGTAGENYSSGIEEQLKDYVGDPYDLANNPPDPFTVPLWDVLNGETGCGDADSGLAYHVKGFAVWQLIGYKVSQGKEYDPWVDPNQCIHVLPAGVDPNLGQRLTAFFVKYIDEDALPGDCEPYGFVYTGRVIK
jgi:hypothetical protein